MKKLALLFAVSAMFVACSDDSSSSNHVLQGPTVASCDIDMSTFDGYEIKIHSCVEVPYSEKEKLAEKCKKIGSTKVPGGSVTATLAEGCKPNYKNICESEDGTIYLYDSSVSCEELPGVTKQFIEQF